VLEDGTFSTYSLPSFYDHRETGERDKRSAGTADKLHLVLPFNGIDHHVELSPYHEFISPDMVVEIRGAGISSDLNAGLKFKRASDQQCHYRGHVRGHHRSRAALSLCNGVVGTSHCPFWIIFTVTRPRRKLNSGERRSRARPMRAPNVQVRTRADSRRADVTLARFSPSSVKHVPRYSDHVAINRRESIAVASLRARLELERRVPRLLILARARFAWVAWVNFHDPSAAGDFRAGCERVRCA